VVNSDQPYRGSLVRRIEGLGTLSTYHAIPSFMSDDRRREASRILADVKRSNVKLAHMTHVKSALRDKLSDAIEFSIEAFEEHIDKRHHKDDRRDDILFRSDFIRPISAAQSALSVTSELL
jgi:hypothetical protein